MISVNCAAVPEALLESEMFGHVRGSFSGALTDRTGFFQAADRALYQAKAQGKNCVVSDDGSSSF